MPPGKASTLLTDHLIIGKPLPGKVVHVKLPYWLRWVVLLDTLFGCHDALILEKWRQRPDTAIAVDWDAKPQLKQIFEL